MIPVADLGRDERDPPTTATMVEMAQWEARWGRWRAEEEVAAIKQELADLKASHLEESSGFRRTLAMQEKEMVELRAMVHAIANK
jgi:hypothetical protein